MTSNDNDDGTKTWLVGIPVRLSDTVMRDRGKYLAIVESVRAHVATLDGTAPVMPQPADLAYAWTLVCERFEEYSHVANQLIQRDHPIRELVARHVESDIAVKTYMALSGATLVQMVDGILAYAAGSIDDAMPEPPVGEARA